MLHKFVQSGAITSAYAFDDGVAGHFIGGELHAVVSSRPKAKGYFVEKTEGKATETELETRYLLA